jgi:outer membrane protein W
MRLMKVLALVAIVALAIPLANAADSKHKLSLFAGYSMPNGDLSRSAEIDEIPVTARHEADDAVGYGLGYEYRYSKLLSFGASLSYWDHEIHLTATDEGGATVFDGKHGDWSWMPLLLDANFHVLGKGAIDLYLGPTVGYAMFGDFKGAGGGNYASSDQFTYGVNVGLDIGLGENWALSGGLRYLLLDGEVDGYDYTIPFDPFIVTVGVGRRF